MVRSSRVAFMAAATVAVALASWPVRGRASEGPSETTVAVLPWTSSAKDLALYGEPVARAVFDRLRPATRVHLQPILGKSPVPDDVDLVVDGRILLQDGEVVLEARVRDPELGQSLAVEHTRAAGLAELDALASELATKLAAAIDRAVARKRAAAQAIAAAPAPRTRTAAAVATAPRAPGMLVVRVQGQVRGGTLDVNVPATTAAVELARRLGYRPIPVAESGLLSPARARELTARYGARYVLVLYVDEIHFAWKRVLTARGRLRVAVLDEQGGTRFDRWVSTDTLVGSRGDGYAALVYFVAEQAGLITEPMIERVLP